VNNTYGIEKYPAPVPEDLTEDERAQRTRIREKWVALVDLPDVTQRFPRSGPDLLGIFRVAQAGHDFLRTRLHDAPVTVVLGSGTEVPWERLPEKRQRLLLAFAYGIHERGLTVRALYEEWLAEANARGYVLARRDPECGNTYANPKKGRLHWLVPFDELPDCEREEWGDLEAVMRLASARVRRLLDSGDAAHSSCGVDAFGF